MSKEGYCWHYNIYEQEKISSVEHEKRCITSGRGAKEIKLVCSVGLIGCYV